MDRRDRGKAVPAAEAALRLSLTREQVIRRQTGSISGYRDSSSHWLYADRLEVTPPEGRAPTRRGAAR